MATGQNFAAGLATTMVPRTSPRGHTVNGGWKASPTCTTQVGNISTSNSLQEEDRHGCRQLATSRCTTYHRSTRGKQV